MVVLICFSVFIGPMNNNPLNFEDDADYDPDIGSGLRPWSRSGGFQSLVDCS